MSGSRPAIPKRSVNYFARLLHFAGTLLLVAVSRFRAEKCRSTPPPRVLISVRPGANPSDVTVTTGYAKYADLNSGGFLVQQLGQAGADRVNAKFASIRTTIEVVVRHRVDDLSF